MNACEFVTRWTGRPTCPHCLKPFESWPTAKLHVKYCRKGSTPRMTVAERLQKGENSMSIKDEFKKKGVEGPPLLHGTDLTAKQTSVTVICKELRVAPDNFGSIAILDFTKPVNGCEAWAINKTNLKALLEKFDMNEDDEISDLSEKMAGKKITLTKVMVNNPQTKKMGPSLFVA